ncbi:MAG: Hsp33 family molecular chaperone HslO [Halioglobus sp.]
MPDSDPATATAGRDCALRFLFEEADIRGEYASLDDSYRELLAIHDYPEDIARLLGEFLAATVILSTTLKFEGKLILQASSRGQVSLLMAECDHQLNVRGIARRTEHDAGAGPLLSDGQLAITIDPVGGQRYQGIVPLSDASLARSLDAYFEHSEQLKTRVWLAADGERACGLLLQQLPLRVTPQAQEREQQWEHVEQLANTLGSEELVAGEGLSLLHKLFHQDPLRVFEPRAVRFACSCSRERTLGALSTLAPRELEELLIEMGTITMDCEFCNSQYRFTREDLTSALGLDESKTLH